MRKAQSAHLLDGELSEIRLKLEIVKDRPLVMVVLRALDSGDCIVNVCTVWSVFVHVSRVGMTYLEKDRRVVLLSILPVSEMF